MGPGVDFRVDFREGGARVAEGGRIPGRWHLTGSGILEGLCPHIPGQPLYIPVLEEKGSRKRENGAIPGV